MTNDERRRIDALIDRSSFGTDQARGLRERTSPSLAAHILRVANSELQAQVSDTRYSKRGGGSMSKPNNRHVVPNSGRGGWDVVAPGASRASSHHRTQADAERAARSIVGNNGGGEVVTHRPNGQIRNSDTVGRPDPFPPRDTK